MITEKSPETWQQLQEWTAQILRECGWSADTETVVNTVRGAAEIDVFAVETVQGREYKTLIECKNWSTRVPQNVVHGFRTVMADVGANTGYIISRVGFQSGAYEAAVNTNVRLLSWAEFQEVFEEQWYWTHLTVQVNEVLDPLCSYLEPLPAMAAWDSYLNESEVSRLVEMYQRHQPLGVLIFALQPYWAMMYGRRDRIRLPLGASAEKYGDLPNSLTSVVGYREFLEELVKYSLPILAEFQSFRDLAFKRRDAENGS